MRTTGENYEVVAQPEDFAPVRQAIEAANLPIANAEYTMEPTDTVALAGKEAGQMLRLMEALEDNEDVQNVHANFDIPDEVLEAEASGH